MCLLYVGWITPYNSSFNLIGIYSLASCFFTYNIPVVGAIIAFYLMCTGIFQLPRVCIEVPFCDVIFLIASLHHSLYLSPSLVNVHSKDISIGFVLYFSYSILVIFHSL